MNRKFFMLLIIALIVIVITGYKMTGNVTKENSRVLIKTSLGDITMELYPDKAPITVENFLIYVDEKAYDGTIFHRVIDGFMIQGGGFTTEGKEKETHDPITLESNNGLKNEKYTVAMARTTVPDSATNQFFINVENNDFLNYGVRDDGYAVFGKVIEGQDVVDKIAKVQTNSAAMPLKNVVIEKIERV
ncbi:peptidylprolyl isomerase [Candidatus Pacearchaeota archaeon RBG_13_36_9]|nr:MAG: peptidylprolyl isomerase [Candidatus Pacearchaeota archaeon RBG_13_36_9]